MKIQILALFFALLFGTKAIGYEYVSNNPVNAIDPLGLEGDSDTPGTQGTPAPIPSSQSQALTRQGVQAQNIAIVRMQGFRNFLSGIVCKGKMDTNTGKLINVNQVGKASEAVPQFNEIVKVGGGTQRTIQTADGTVQIATFPDGGTASLRTFSSSKAPGVPTIQITPPSGPQVKLRYDAQ